MKKIFYALFCFVVIVKAECIITFQVDLTELIDNNLYSQENTILVRGNFNNWSGFDSLSNIDGENIYTGIFTINQNIGDTLEYKFVIQQSNDRFYWESNPNPENPNNGNRKIVINNLEMTLPTVDFVYDEFIKYPVIFSKDKLLKDYDKGINLLKLNHPALYDYTKQPTLDTVIDHRRTQIVNEMPFNEFFVLLSSVTEKVGCGHTKPWVPNLYWETLPCGIFPCKLMKNRKGVFIAEYYEEAQEIPIGSRILSINNETIDEIWKELMSFTPSDGFIEAFKSKVVEIDFAKNYHLRYGCQKNFEIQYLPYEEKELKTAILQPISIKKVLERPQITKELKFELLDNDKIAYIRIHSFAYYDEVDFFKGFIDSCFLVIKDKKIENLILDLRDNNGGDPFCSSPLFAYLIDTPHPYFEKEYHHYEGFEKPFQVAENNFTGKLYTLIDGNCFSTTGHFCGLLKYHNIGKFVGGETGATFTCTGSVMYENLEHTKIIFGTARRSRYSAAVKNMDPMRGVIPDFPVEQTQKDLIDNNDTVLEFTIELINRE
ncbi:MAG: hypothetical protein JXQ65_04700 [Candidatus Marinimicrobia bacterium]|nr:hypothetical protein [Candidatus Neomarinimicrobiota bacterium]